MGDPLVPWSLPHLMHPQIKQPCPFEVCGLQKQCQWCNACLGPLPPSPEGTLGYCTCAQEAISTKRRNKMWLVSGPKVGTSPILTATP